MLGLNYIYSALIINGLVLLTSAQFDCRATPCQNNGSCLELSKGNDTFGNDTELMPEYVCECDAGYTGIRCELSAQNCETNIPCLNRGTCLKNLNTKKYSCFCNAGYYGEICHMTNLCLNSKCLNGATCYPIADISFICLCPSGLTGPTCERYIEPKYCKLNLCRNGGSCTVEPSGLIQCMCMPGFIGNACEIDTTVCQKKTCSYNGVCQSEMNGDYSCLCDPLYGGKDCEIANICQENMCLNGGVCQTLKKDTFKCFCSSQFDGPKCEYRICEMDYAVNSTQTVNSTTRNSTTSLVGEVVSNDTQFRRSVSGLFRLLKTAKMLRSK